MTDPSMTNQELIKEISVLKRIIKELEPSESERKQAEELLRTLSSRQEAIMAAVPEIIMEMDNNKVYTWGNLAGIEFFGEDVIGKEAVFYFEGEQEIYERQVSPIFTGAENIISVESWQRRKDGEKRLLAWWCRVLKDENGQVTGALSSAHDITARKRIEDELRRNQEVAERLAQEMVIIAEIGLLIGSTLHIDEVYERFAAETQKLILIDSLTVNLYNYQENTLLVAYVYGLNIGGRSQGDPLVMEGSLSEAVIRTRSSIRIQPACFDEIAGQFPRLSPIFEAGLRSIMCVPLVYRDEVIGVLHFRSKKQNVYTEQDLRLAERIGMQIAGAMVNARLFSDLQKTENSLRKSEGRFRGLVEKAAVGVAEIDINTGRFLMVNSRLCEMMGRTEEEMFNTTFQAITHPEDLHLHEEKTRMMLAGEIGHYSLEKRYLRKDAGIVWVNITVSPLWRPGEAPGRNISVVEDITDRKWMEAEILVLSITDQLTGLHNRRGFLSLAEQQLKLAIRNKSGTLLFFADLDGLKWINDTLGHEEGDKVLIEAATVLKETFRASDIVARLGGDEYAALAVHINEANSEIITARLQSLIYRRNSQENRRYRLSISVGCSYYDPENPSSIDQLMASADKLMYEHKQKKKGFLLQGASLSSLTIG